MNKLGIAISGAISELDVAIYEAKKVGDTLLAEALDEIFEELDRIDRSLY